jgi:uncharacterized protein involved in exopolysaccharide biosynthesis
MTGSLGGFYSISQMLVAVRERRKLVIIAAVAVMFGAMLLTLVMPRSFVATATLIFNPPASDPIAERGDSTESIPAYLNTELDLIASDRVLERMAQDRILLGDPAVQRQLETAQGASAQMWLKRAAKANISIASGKNSRKVAISAAASDPAFAAALANAVARAYMATNLELRLASARQNSAFFAAQKQRRYTAIVEAQRRLADFLSRTGMTGLEASVDVDGSQLRTLGDQVAQSQVEMARASADSALGGSGMVSAGLIANPVVQRLQGVIAEQSAALDELSVLRGPNYPTVIQARARLGELRMQLAAENGKIGEGLHRRRAAMASSAGQISALEKGKRALVTASSANRSALSVLAADVERAQADYDAIAKRLHDVETAAALDAPNVSLLSAAAPPSSPSSPSLPLNLLIGLLLGGVLGVLAALAAELFDGRVRSLPDLEQYLPGTPVLGVLTA